MTNWIVLDSEAEKHGYGDSPVVAIFSTEQKLLDFTSACKPYFDSGRFTIQAEVNVDPDYAISIQHETKQ